jgi:O-antigen/teichoic acid export membrane protein
MGNYVFSIGGQGMVAIASTARLFMVGRRLSADDYGHFALAFAVVLGCQTVFLGMTQTTIGSLAPRKEGEALKRFVTAAVMIQLLAAVVLVSGVVATAFLFFSGRDRTLLLLSSAALAASTLRFIAYPVQYSLLNFRGTLKLDTFASLSQITVYAAVLYGLHKDTAEWAVAALAISEVIWSLASIPLFARFLVRPKQLGSDFREILAFGRFSLAASLSNYSLNYGAVLILGANVPLGELGGFAASKNLARMNEPLTFALGNILRVESSRAVLGAEQGAAHRRSVKRTLTLGIASSALSSLVLAVLYPLAFKILFAGKFLAFGHIVWILSASKILEALAFFFVAILNGSGSPVLVYRATLISGTLNLILLAIGSHWFGVLGAAVATITGAAFYAVVLGRFLQQHPVASHAVPAIEGA